MKLRARGASASWASVATLAALGVVALASWVIRTNSSSSPAPPGKPASVEKERNWIWQPTAEDLKRAEGVEGGALRVLGPIVDEATGEMLTGRVYINGELVADGVQEVDVLMWGTEERPVFLRVEASGHSPWEMRFRFRHEGLGELKGPIRLKPANLPSPEASRGRDELPRWRFGPYRVQGENNKILLTDEGPIREMSFSLVPIRQSLDATRRPRVGSSPPAFWP